MPTIGVDARSLLCKEPRGEGKTLLRLYEEMLRQRPDLRVWFFGDSNANDFQGALPEGISVDASRSWGHRIDGWENFSLPWRAWRRGCEVLHCASSSAPAWSPMPIVMTVHDMIPTLRMDGQSEAEGRHFLRRFRRGMRQAKHIIAVSAHTKRDLLAVSPNQPASVSVVHWGCDIPPARLIPRTLPARFVVTFGGAARRKNTNYTMQRFAAAAEQVPDVRLLILGISQQEKRDKLLQLASDLRIADRVDIPGFVSEIDLDRLLYGASALLYLSLYEGFGLPVLEAIARDVAVISSSESSLPELLPDAPGCLSLSNPKKIEETLIKLLVNDQFAKDWRSKQRKTLERFSWPNTAKETLTLLLGVDANLR